jgi:hypothetical protein
MAKKRAGSSEGTQAETRAKTKGKGAGTPQGTILVYKADSSTAEKINTWLTELSDHVGAPVTVTVDMALKAFAEAHGFKPMPKRRVR